MEGEKKTYCPVIISKGGVYLRICLESKISIYFCLTVLVIIIKRKPKGQSRMDNQETLTTLGTQETGWRQQNTKTDEKHGPHQKPRVHLGARKE